MMKVDEKTERILMTKQNEYRKVVEKEIKRLNQKLSYLDRTVSDIHHDVELSNLSGAELMKDVCLLRDILRERRIVKTTIIALKAIQRNNQTKATFSRIKKAKPIYTVRELKGLKIAQRAA